MNETQHGIECLKSILRAAQAYREDASSEGAGAVLTETLQAELVAQRQRHDKLVHERVSKEHELNTSLDRLKQLRVESASGIQDQASQRQLRVEHNKYAKALMKLREAQSMEQLYTAMLLQLETDQSVARKDLADMEAACKKAEREMLQLQQQLKQCGLQRSAAYEQHHRLTQLLQAAKQEARNRLQTMQQSILQCCGRAEDQPDVAQTCTLEAALADVDRGEAQLRGLTERAQSRTGHAVHHSAAGLVSMEPVASSPCAEAAVEHAPLKQKIPATSAPHCGDARMTHGSQADLLSVAPDRHPHDGGSCLSKQTSRNTQYGAAEGATDDVRINGVPATDGSKPEGVPNCCEGTAGPEGTAVCTGSVCEPGQNTADGHQRHKKRCSDGGDDDQGACAEAETGDGAVADQTGSAATEEELDEAWAIVARCVPSIGGLVRGCSGGKVEAVVQLSSIVAEAHKEMEAVLREWIASGEDELARQREGTFTIPDWTPADKLQVGES